MGRDELAAAVDDSDSAGCSWVYTSVETGHLTLPLWIF
jgi:hypothetical protein